MEQLHDDGVHGPQPAPAEHIYTNQTSPYFRAPQISIAIAARFFEGRRVLTDEQAQAINVNPQYFQDTSDAVLMTTRGGHVYDRTFLEGFLKPGIGPRNWVSRTNYPALNVVSVNVRAPCAVGSISTSSTPTKEAARMREPPTGRG